MAADYRQTFDFLGNPRHMPQPGVPALLFFQTAFFSASAKFLY
jgi:hypothetical protein